MPIIKELTEYGESITYSDLSMTIDINEANSTKPTVKGLCGLVRKLGYRDPFHQLHNDDGTVVGDLLCFLEDNPGACLTVIDWIALHFGIEEDDSENEECVED